LQANTYYARVHVMRLGPDAANGAEEVDVDARPSDAINLALRCSAPLYIHKRVVRHAKAASQGDTHLGAMAAGSGGHHEQHADVARSVRATIASFYDPTVVCAMQRDVAVRGCPHTEPASVDALALSSRQRSDVAVPVSAQAR
jgi:hypothetical protein